MPVHIEERNGKYCVVEPSGESKKCYDNRGDAVSYMRAINANIDKQENPTVRSILESRIHRSFTTAADDLFGLGYIDRERRIELSSLIGDVLTQFGDSIDVDVGNEKIELCDAQEIMKGDGIMGENSSVNYLQVEGETPDMDTGTITVSTGSANTWESVSADKTKVDEDYLEEKGFYGPPPMTFDELEKERQAYKEEQEVAGLLGDFMALSGNVIALEENKISGLRKLVKDFLSRLGKDDNEEKNEEKEVVEPKDKKGGFMVWKEANGTWRWFGVYSNKFRDNDTPSEIIADRAHKEFIDRVNKGILAYPDLYVWHIPVPVGKADLLAYDNSGFSVVSGTFKSERVALGLSRTHEDLAMSHGMPTEHIMRAKDDPTVITRYVSTEVSVLPRYAAANKMTDFRILSKEEKGMTFPNEQREEVVELLGESATAEIEEALAAKARVAEDAGVEHKSKDEKPTEETAEEKEAEVQVEEVAEAQADTSEAVVDIEVQVEEGVASGEPEVVEADELVETEEEVKGEPAGDALAGDAGDAGDAGEQDAMKEIVDVLTAFTKSLDEKLESNAEKFNERLGALEERFIELERSEDERLAEKATGTPTASLAAALAQGLRGAGQAESVIGNQATHVHGNSKLAKDKPQETEADPQDGRLFFQSWTK
jgi:hypothetical protein